MSITLLAPQPYAGGRDLWADVDFTAVPADTRKMIERARLADTVLVADLEAINAALWAQLQRSIAVANEFSLQLEKAKAR